MACSAQGPAGAAEEGEPVIIHLLLLLIPPLTITYRERESHYREEVGGGGGSPPSKATPPSKTAGTPGGAGQQVHATAQDWERIAKLVEAGVKSVGRGTKDTSRMKSLILAYASPSAANGSE